MSVTLENFVFWIPTGLQYIEVTTKGRTGRFLHPLLELKFDGFDNGADYAINIEFEKLAKMSWDQERKEWTRLVEGRYFGKTWQLRQGRSCVPVQ